MVFILTSLINKIKNGRAIAIYKWTVGKLCNGRYQHNKAITTDMSVAALCHVGDSHLHILCTGQQYLLVLQTVPLFFFKHTKQARAIYYSALFSNKKHTKKTRRGQFTILLLEFKQKTQKRRGVANLPFFFVFKHVRETRSSKLTVLLCVTTHKRPSSVAVHSSGSTPTCNCCTVLYSSRSLKNHQQKVNITPQLATTQTVHK